MGLNIELHTTDREDPIISYGKYDQNEPIRIFVDNDEKDDKKYILYGQEDNDDDEYETVCCIDCNCINCEDERKQEQNIDIEKILKKRIKINVHTNDEFKVLWNIKDDLFLNTISSAVIDCVIQNDMDNKDKWKSDLELVKQYMDKEKKRPSPTDKNEEIKRLGKWVGHQQANYKEKTFIMKNEKIYDLWTEFINDPKYSVYFVNPKDKWKSDLEQVKQYMDKEKKKPSRTDKNEEIKRLGKWVATQQPNYKKKTYIMKNEKIYELWTEFINDPKYSVYFDSPEDKWKSDLEQVKQYMDKEKKRPSYDRDKNKDIKRLGTWVGTQQKNYKKKTYIMANKEIYDLWTEFTADYLSGNYKKKQSLKECQHKWKVTRDDEIYNYKECELCGRKSKESRLASITGYKESNPQKKSQINEWLSGNEYIRGKAVILDAKGLKTSRKLVESGEFKVSDIIIPEYDADMYDENRKDKEFGMCLKNGDYLEILKGVKPSELSLIYADFTGSYEKLVKPLLNYLKLVKDELMDGLIVGITWSNNGVGTASVRSKILREIGRYSSELELEEIEESPTQTGYGIGSNMNVIFYRKNTEDTNKIDRHTKTKNHQDYLSKNNSKPESKFEKPCRESLINEISKVTKNNKDYTDWTVDELNSRLEGLKFECW